MTATLEVEVTSSATRAGRLNGKVALITGGNSGIGFATAQAYHAEGAHVIITGRDDETLRSAGDALGTDIMVRKADVMSTADLEAVMHDIRTQFGRLDVLVVNAGVAAFAPVQHATEAHFDHIFDINVKGAYFTIQRAVPLLARGSSVIIIGSINGLIGMPGSSVYAASKAAVRSFARTMSADLNELGIRVNVISPGPVSTPLFGKLGFPADALAAAAAGIQAQVPLGRFGEPREIAQTAVFLASDESTFFVGAELVADGGMSQL